jgi:hypothetical protein
MNNQTSLTLSAEMFLISIAAKVFNPRTTCDSFFFMMSDMETPLIKLLRTVMLPRTSKVAKSALPAISPPVFRSQREGSEPPTVEPTEMFSALTSPM